MTFRDGKYTTTINDIQVAEGEVKIVVEDRAGNRRSG
jgi:hypothetical protein